MSCILRIILFLNLVYAGWSWRREIRVTAKVPSSLTTRGGNNRQCLGSSTICACIPSFPQTVLRAARTHSLSIMGSATLPTVSIVPGILSGGLHAITGPDHLAAILPASVGQTFLGGCKIGAAWGLGHGITASILGIILFFLKGRMSSQFSFLSRLSWLAESVVGISLVAIGLIGVKESLVIEEEDDLDTADGSIYHSAPVEVKKPLKAIFANGILHGLSFDGAPSIAPALAMVSWRSTIKFLLAYCLGTMVTMSLSAGVVSNLILVINMHAKYR